MGAANGVRLLRLCIRSFAGVELGDSDRMTRCTFGDVHSHNKECVLKCDHAIYLKWYLQPACGATQRRVA